MKHVRTMLSVGAFVSAPLGALIACGANGGGTAAAGVGGNTMASAGHGGSSASSGQTSSGNTMSSTGTGGAANACPPCLQTSQCASGSLCAQFADDQYCAPDCSTNSCAADRTCTPVHGADGTNIRVCIPNTNVCGGMMTGAGGASTSSTSTGTSASTTTTSSSSGASSTTRASSSTTTASSSSSASGGTCTHSPCVAGGALVASCEACVATVCAGDAYCCNTKWDAQCVGEAAGPCSCSGTTSTTTSSTTTSSGTTTSSSSSSTTSSSGSSGSIGPGGGTLSTLSFAIVGDTRPPTEDDTSGYPTAVITKIWQDVEAASPRPAFAITTGDYMFASPSHTPGTQSQQMGFYMGARAAFSNILFPAMGNHECDGSTGDNCYACGSACNNVSGSCIGGWCQTPNFTVFASKMLAPINQTLPYYTININGTGNAWTAKFVYIACNAWSPTQATWLGSQLATPTTYTFVVRHESPGTSGAPCVTASPSADSITTAHPFTLIIAGHTHTYAYYSSEKLVVVGNGGAPLSNSVNYGYVIARQQPGGKILFSEYDYATNALQSSFSVQ